MSFMLVTSNGKEHIANKYRSAARMEPYGTNFICGADQRRSARIICAAAMQYAHGNAVDFLRRYRRYPGRLIGPIRRFLRNQSSNKSLRYIRINV